ncbi:hypothetical protein OAC89_06265 [Deltaproteobacteria bacterium]|nr:hypothetical protein [Deltaproteobacteria bacterium]
MGSPSKSEVKQVVPFSLCFPDGDKSCFACCPPIRSADYDHIQYKNIIKRVLRENSQSFNKKDRSVVPITGFNCWALGYIRQGHKLVGCMLHPAQNRGVDLRYRIDYGDKCRRESCWEAKAFSQLGIVDKKFWLHLVDGLDSFAYSSKEINPLFKMIGWGIDTLHLIALKEKEKVFNRDSFFLAYPFFRTRLIPKGNAYLLKQFLKKRDISFLRKESFRSAFEIFSVRISKRIINESADAPEGQYVHLLDIDREFSDFLRLSARKNRMGHERVSAIKSSVDEELDNFCTKIQS